MLESLHIPNFQREPSVIRLIMIFITLFWTVFMTFLSHQNGHKSGEESRWISERLRILDHLTRHSAHVLVYMVFTILLLATMRSYGIDMRIGILAAVLYSIIDEVTKPLCIFRHWSTPEELLNILGIALGAALSTFIMMPIG